MNVLPKAPDIKVFQYTIQMSYTDINYWVRLVERRTQRAVVTRSFSALVGFQPQVFVLLWSKYHEDFNQYSITPIQILMSLSFLKVYASLDVMSRIWKMSRSNFHRVVWHVIGALRNILDEVSSLFQFNSIIKNMSR